jgi:hypothetical protein
MSWVSTAGLSLKIEASPDTLPVHKSIQPQAPNGRIYLHKMNQSRIPLYLEYHEVKSSVSSVATVTKSDISCLTVPGRASKYTAAPTPSNQDDIGMWIPGQTVGTVPITAVFHVRNAVDPIGSLTLRCDITTTEP